MSDDVTETLVYSDITVVHIKDTGFADPLSITSDFLDVTSIEQNSSGGTTVYTVKGTVEGAEEDSVLDATMFATVTADVLSYYYIYQ